MSEAGLIVSRYNGRRSRKRVVGDRAPNSPAESAQSRCSIFIYHRSFMPDKGNAGERSSARRSAANVTTRIHQLTAIKCSQKRQKGRDLPARMNPLNFNYRDASRGEPALLQLSRLSLKTERNKKGRIAARRRPRRDLLCGLGVSANGCVN
jgi:hypothetical protein